jgi:hypothetical protein
MINISLKVDRNKTNQFARRALIFIEKMREERDFPQGINILNLDILFQMLNL